MVGTGAMPLGSWLEVVSRGHGRVNGCGITMSGDFREQYPNVMVQDLIVDQIKQAVPAKYASGKVILN